MLSFVSPMWMVGLLLLPIIRWLHRGGRRRHAVPVSHVDLWQASTASNPAAGQRQPPDPAWRRRALLTALLFVALARPQGLEQRAGITVWVDDSLSMLTREANGTRLAEGLAQASSLLEREPGLDFEVRTLSEPWHNFGPLTKAVIATIIAGAGRNEPAAPPAALLGRDGPHWLVTDGADAALFEWHGERRPDHIIQVGGVTQNVGLERLSARRNLTHPEQYDLLLKVVNGGTVVETRTVILTTHAGEVARSTYRLEPGAFALVNALIPAAASVRATLQPADALAEDDEIALDLSPLRRRRVAADAKCPTVLLAAVDTHPSLALAQGNSTNVEAALDCGTHGAPDSVATIRVHAEHAPTRPRGSVQWSSAVPGSQRVRLDTEQLQLAAHLEARPVDAVLLAVGDEPLIVSRTGASRLLETSLDFGSAQFAGGPEIPLLVNLMFERLLGSSLLDGIAIVDRGAASSKVAASKRAGADSSAHVPNWAHAVRDESRPFLLAAMLVLLWEMIALGHQWYLLRQFAEPAIR